MKPLLALYRLRVRLWHHLTNWSEQHLRRAYDRLVDREVAG